MNNGGIHQRTLSQHQILLSQVLSYRSDDLLSQLVLLQNVAECQDGGGIWYVASDQINPGKAADARNINSLIFHGRITEEVPVLHQMEP